jgi:hypothetical protein
MTDVEDRLKKWAEENGYNTNVPIFNDNYNTIMSFDISRTLPENPVEEQQVQNTEPVEEES